MTESAESAAPEAAKPKGILLPWQGLLYKLLLIPIGVMAANSIYLIGFTRNTAFFMAMLLLHLGLGIAITLPFFLFAATHAKKMIHMKNRRAKYAGLAIFSFAVVCVASGVYMVSEGATLNNRVIYLAHAFAIPLALVAFVLHRRSHSHKLAFRKLYAWGGAVAIFLGAMIVAQKLEKPPQRVVNNDGDTLFFPSFSETFDQGLLEARQLANNKYCADCHPDSFHQWERSAHRFSSFNNPFYRRAVELMADRVGRERTKWCSGCHDPVVLFSGQMGKATQAKFSYDQFEAQQGLTCMSCHSITEVKDVRGNGSYVIEESQQYPFAFTDNAWLKELNHLLIRMEPSLHRKTFMKPFMRTPEFCSTCHKVSLIPALNDYKWMRGQNHYDTWQDSGVSGYNVRSFYDAPQPKACRDCHLPPQRSNEFGNQKGFLHDHLFPAANTALPTLRGDAETRDRILKFLQDGVLSCDIFAIKRGGETLPLGSELPALRPGETLDVEVVVRTRKMGHPYTNGTADSNETWVEFSATNAARTLMKSGTLAADGRLDTAAEMLSVLAIGHDGEPMDRRQPQDIHATLFSNQIPPGAARVVHYRLRVPQDARGEIEIAAAVHYRKFSREYSVFVGGKDAPLLPIATLASDRVTLGVGETARQAGDRDAKRANADPLWLRWNDYGIGLFLQGDLKGAQNAWKKVAELAEDKPDGPVNLARAYVQEGDLPAASTALAEAERRAPGFMKTAFFRAQVAREEGRLADAERDLLYVQRRYPKDRVVWGTLGRVRYLAGRFREAVEAFEAVLAIDPEDLNAHYNLMLTWNMLGDAKRGEIHAASYRRFKDDESSTAVMADFRQSHPWANRMSQPIHVIDNPEAAFSPVPAWFAKLSAHGYEYEGINEERSPYPQGEQAVRAQQAEQKPSAGKEKAPPLGVAKY